MIKKYYYSIKNENNKIWMYIYIGNPNEHIKNLKEISNKEIFLKNLYIKKIMILTNNMLEENIIISLKNCVIEQYEYFVFLPINISINYDNCAFMYKGKI